MKSTIGALLLIIALACVAAFALTPGTAQRGAESSLSDPVIDAQSAETA